MAASKKHMKYKNFKTSTDIKSESEEVVLELPSYDRTLSLSAAGRAKEMHPVLLGDYILTEREHNDRPVYRDSEDRHLWSQEDGTWAASWDVGNIWPVMRSTTAAVSPGLCQHWQYADILDGWKYKPGDITVTSNIHK